MGAARFAGSMSGRKLAVDKTGQHLLHKINNKGCRFACTVFLLI